MLLKNEHYGTLIKTITSLLRLRFTVKMKQRYILVWFEILTACSVQNQRSAFFEKPNYIAWSETKKLEVLDFKAMVKPLDVRVINVAACCASSIYMKSEKNFRYIWDGKVNNVEVVSFFDCSRSWFDKSHLDNDILEHEQIHFDITELIARRLRKKIHLYSKAMSPSSLQLEYKSSLYSLNDIQEKYDSETDHGRLYKKQVEWKERIQKELIDLSEYQK